MYDTSLRLTRITDSRASNDATKILDESYCYTSYSSGTCVAAVTTPTTSTDRDQQQGFKDELAGIVTNYAYNPDNRLASATPASGTGPTFSYTYDKAGNRLSKTKTVGGTPSTTYAAFNSDSQLCWTGPTSGTCASPPGGSATNYVYDRDGNQTTSPTNVSTYNGTDQTLTIAHGGGAAGSYGYTNTSQDQRVSAPGINYRNGLLGVQSEIAGGVFSYYERDPAGGLVAMIQGGTEYSYAMDGYGNVRYLVDNTGTVQTGYTYDPYGDNGTESGPNYTLGDNNHYRYRGEYFDYATNQYKIGKRYYDPISGTWTQQDSINIIGDPATGNHYSYTDGDPVNQVDPDGAHSWWRDAIFPNSMGISYSGCAVVCLSVSIGTDGVNGSVGCCGVAERGPSYYAHWGANTSSSWCGGAGEGGFLGFCGNVTGSDPKLLGGTLYLGAGAGGYFGKFKSFGHLW